jgi:quercetin dioxygenase-like cupin family protein
MLIDWEKLPTVTAGMQPGASRKGICGDKLSMVLVTTEAGATFDGVTHWHDNEQLLVMIEGWITLTVDGNVFDVHAGESAFFPPGSRHAALGCAPEGCVYYEIFAPARPDQLPGWIGGTPLRFD